MLYILLALCLFGRAYAQIVGVDSCPEISTVADFDSSQYLGQWYEHQKYFKTFEIGAKCITANYTAGVSGNIKVVTTQISSITDQKSSVEGFASVPDYNEPGKLKVIFFSIPYGVEADYWVLGTDYKTYSVVYSCVPKETHFNDKFVSILTRERNPPQSVINAALKVVSDNKLDKSVLMKTDQIDCPYN